MSSTNSQCENRISCRLFPVKDQLAERLLARVVEALSARPDLDRREFARRIGRPTPSWISEFCAGKRTTNDLRLVLQMAQVLGVPASYLLGETQRSNDAEEITLVSAFRDLKRYPDLRAAVLELALRLRQTAAPGDTSVPHNATADPGPRTPPRRRAHRAARGRAAGER